MNHFPIENMAITNLNREPARTPWRAFASEEQAKNNEPSQNIVSLNGQWQFKLYPNPNAIEPFYQPGHAREGFVRIPVPSHWELEGHGEPRYTNYIYPWAYEGAQVVDTGKSVQPLPPNVPSDNDCGCYYHEFEVRETGGDVFIRFDGVETAYKLWINGKFVGYSEDSKLPSEFNVSQYVQKGLNSVAVQVVRFTKASYIEDQDYWHISGIFGGVSLIYKAKTRIEDYHITAKPSGTSGHISADVKITPVHHFTKYAVSVSVYGANGQLLAQSTAHPAEAAQRSVKQGPNANTARVTLNIPDITPWTTETPVLYRLVMSLISPDGEVTDVEACNIGFKTLEIRNGVLYLNNKRIIFQGVNRHQHHYQTGRNVSREWMRKEIIEMKRMNINAVRTSHYPCHPMWYELCDEMGILLVCEANLETHGVSGQLTQDPAWSNMFLERAVRMVQVFKNHVSIYAWSLGNESGCGPNHGAMAGFIREYDPTRLCQYEDGNPSGLVSDVRGTMYAPIDAIERMAGDPNDIRPIILVEYLYQIRSGGGGLYHFRQLVEKYERFQGGFVWDWQDKALECETEDGKKFFGYGTDFGRYYDNECPPFMTNNGIVLPDLRWKPVAHELKQAYAPIVVREVAKIYPWRPYDYAPNQYEIQNRTYTKPLSDYEITMVLLEDGHEVRQEKIAHNELAPGETTTITIVPNYELDPAREYFIEFRILEKERTAHAPAGYEVARFQYELQAPNTVYKPTGLVGEDVASYIDDKLITLSASGVEAYLCRETGALTLRKGNDEYVKLGGTPALDRPMSCIDAEPSWGGMANVFPLVRDGNTEVVLDEADLINADTAVAIFKITTIKNGAELVTYAKNIYTLLPSGDLEVDFSININRGLAFVPRAGLEFVLPAGFDKLSFYGLGGNENYPDRQMSAFMGVYESNVRDEHFPYSPPSECGGHGNTRWVSLENEKGARLNVIGHSPFHFHALGNSVADYHKAMHDHELLARDEVYLNIDAAHSGIGSNMSWGSHVSEEHMVKAGVHGLKFVLQVD